MQHARIITLVTATLLTSLVSGACQAETAQQRGKDIAQGCAAVAMPLRQLVTAPIPPHRAFDPWMLEPT